MGILAIIIGWLLLAAIYGSGSDDGGKFIVAREAILKVGLNEIETDDEKENA